MKERKPKPPDRARVCPECKRWTLLPKKEHSKFCKAVKRDRAGRRR